MIIFICTGNTCRSPMAEAIAKDMFKQMGIKIDVCSRGVGTYGNEKASAHSIEALLEYGLNLDGHISRRLTEDEAEQAELILTMTLAHKLYIDDAFPPANGKTFTLTDYVYDIYSEISDPYGDCLETYKKCAAELHDAIKLLSQKISETKAPHLRF